MKINVVICSYRRPDSLERTLASIAEADPPLAAEWRVLVVDNADCADTQRIARSFAGRLPIGILVEPKAGLSHARNAAMARLDGDYAIWTDDDVAVSPKWLRNYEAAFAAHPDAAFFGGPIAPQFEGRPPEWLTNALPWIKTAFASLDLASKAKAGRLGGKHLPFGANMAIRVRELLALQFDVTRGRQPGSWLLSGEESELLGRICQSGGFGIWVPDAPVTHWIDAERQTIAYLRTYYQGLGIAEARAAQAQPATPEKSPALLWCQLAISELTWLCGWMLREPRLWANALKKASRLRAALAVRREQRCEPALNQEMEA